MKKPSVANSRSKPLEPFTFFLDRSLGRNVVVAALRKAGMAVEVHDDHFPIDAKDEEWLSVVGKKGWVVLTKDRRIRYRHHERIAVKRAGARVFALTRGDLLGEEMAGIFIRALPAMIRFAMTNPPPFIATLSQCGTISKIL